MGGTWPVRLGGVDVWAYAADAPGGVRLRLDLTDWERSGLCVGQRVPVRFPGCADVWLFVTAADYLPPVAWVSLERWARVAGSASQARAGTPEPARQEVNV
jgi:hypothetical protein